jgi:hypothetical protein
VGIANAWHGGSHDDETHALWIDDDSSEGVFAVKRIADRTGIRPCFTVIADRMPPVVADSLASWQQQGAADIALHGLRHDHWKDWSEAQIAMSCRRAFCGFISWALTQHAFSVWSFPLMAAIQEPSGMSSVNRVFRW